jgi:hypothetical protein
MTLKLTMLRLEILGCLAYNGGLSKSMVEGILKKHTHITKTNRRVKHHRAEILKAFRFLNNNGLVISIKSNPGQGLVYGKGRPKIYYKITYEGIKLLISNNLHPLKLWKAIIGYCHHNDTKVSLTAINEIYQLFLNEYLKFPNHGFSFQLDIFDNMRDKWLDELILNDANVNLYQKVIEVLAIYPESTLKEIVKKTNENESEIRKVISTYTTESYTPLVENTYYIYQNIVGKKYNKKYWDLLLHSIVVSNQKKNIETYRLSLFGVILCLTLVRYYDMDKLKHGLFYKDVPFPDYYDKIADNYKDKLPLILGKWSLLKNILRLFSAYNFDIILDKEIHLSDSDKLSIIRGGNKELHDGIREIVLQTRQQLEDFASSGMSIWSHYIGGIQNENEESKEQDYDYLINNNVNTQGKPDPRKVYAVYKKLNEIILLLHPIEEGFPKSTSLQEDFRRKIVHQLEEQFADEITALYYFHLYFEYEFSTRIGQPTKYYSSINNDESQFPIYSKPKNCLLSILQNDKSEPLLDKWFSQWIQDISSLQKQLYEALKVRT